MIKALRFLICLILLTIFINPAVSLANEQVLSFGNEPSSGAKLKLEAVKYESINPIDGYKYNFKRLQEKFLFLLAFSDSAKLDLYKDILSRRLAELKYVVDNKDLSNIQTVSQRYAQTAGEMTDFTFEKKKNDKNSIKKILEDQLLVIELLEKPFNDNSAEWRFIKHDADYLKIYISKLSN